MRSGIEPECWLEAAAFTGDLRSRTRSRVGGSSAQGLADRSRIVLAAAYEVDLRWTQERDGVGAIRASVFS
jgi:hypothetical protein